jgi:hypothetical protein
VPTVLFERRSKLIQDSSASEPPANSESEVDVSFPLSVCNLLLTTVADESAWNLDLDSSRKLVEAFNTSITFAQNLIGMLSNGDDPERFSGAFLCTWNSRARDCRDHGCFNFCLDLGIALGVVAYGVCTPWRGLCFCDCFFEGFVPWWRKLLLALLVLALVALLAFIIANLVAAAWPAILRMIQALIAQFPELAALLGGLLELIKQIIFGGGGGRVPNPT